MSQRLKKIAGKAISRLEIGMGLWRVLVLHVGIRGRRSVNSKIGSWLSQKTWQDNRKTARITMFFVQFPRERLALSGHVDQGLGESKGGSTPHEHFSRDTRRFDCVVSLQRYACRYAWRCAAMPATRFAVIFPFERANPKRILYHFNIAMLCYHIFDEMNVLNDSKELW